MIIDPTFFGYGAGLVILGFVCGLIASAIFSALGRIF